MVVTSAQPVNAVTTAESRASGGGVDGRWAAAVWRVAAFRSTTDRVRRTGPTEDNGAEKLLPPRHTQCVAHVFGVTPGQTTPPCQPR